MSLTGLANLRPPGADEQILATARTVPARVGGPRFTAFGEGTVTSWNFLMPAPAGAVVDLHGTVLPAQGNGVLRLSEAGNAYAMAAPSGHGTIGDRTVEAPVTG